MFKLFLFVLEFIPIFCTDSSTYKSYPVVLWHGMGDSCCNPISLGKIVSIIENEIPNVYVKSIQIGSNMIEDIENSFFMNANEQVAIACDKIKKDQNLKDGYNSIGFSQGGQFLRALAQRCPEPKMHTLISLGGQHQGVYGLPYCLYQQHKFCDYLRSLLNHGAYWGWVQKQFVQAEYWHDPLNEQKYKEGSIFLADINQERDFNVSYKENLSKLSNLVLVKFLNDTMVQPTATEWFGFYSPGQSKKITNLMESDIYKKDLLGLKGLYESGRLHFLSTPGEHLEFTREWFVDIINTYLKSK